MTNEELKISLDWIVSILNSPESISDENKNYACYILQIAENAIPLKEDAKFKIVDPNGHTEPKVYNSYMEARIEAQDKEYLGNGKFEIVYAE